MKIAEKWFEQDGKLVHQKTHDWTGLLDQTEKLRSNGLDGFGESKLVGRIVMDLWALWAKEAGISASDPDFSAKMKEVVHRKMLDGEFAKLRVWQGKY
mgnify:CR=1 FL=1